MKQGRARDTDDPPGGLNGLGSPLGIETVKYLVDKYHIPLAKWPGEPVRD